MERIGVVLARLGLDPVSLAVRGHDGAHNYDGPTSGVAVGPMQSGMDGMGMGDGSALCREAATADPSMPVSERSTAGNGGEKARAEAPAVRSGGRPGGLKLIWINRGPGASAVPHRAYGFPYPAPGLRLVQVSEHHTVSG